MIKLQVTFDLCNSFDNCTNDQILNWLKYELGQIGNLNCPVSLYEQDIKASNVSMKLVHKED